MTFDTDALAVWMNSFFALAAVSGLLAVAAVVMLIVSTRNAGRPAPRNASRPPVLARAYPGAATTDRAA
jgi:hypothetical protein